MLIDSFDPGVVAKLGGNTPSAILADRSLFRPVEPPDPEFANRVWSRMENYPDARLPHCVVDMIRARSFPSRVDANFGINVDKEVLAGTLTLEALEWYLHTTEPERGRDLTGFNSVAGLLGGVIEYQSRPSLEFDKERGRTPQTDAVFVVPEKYDGRIDRVVASLKGSHRFDQHVAVIGNVNTMFASDIPQGAQVELYGDAGDDVASCAARVQYENGRRPVVVVHGSVGDYAGRSARSLMMHVDGDAGTFVGTRAGYLPEHHHGPETATSVMIRVDGVTGEDLGHGACGAIDISAGRIASVGHVLDVTKGVVHEGPYALGSPNSRLDRGTILYENGHQVRTAIPEHGGKLKGEARPAWLDTSPRAHRGRGE